MAVMQVKVMFFYRKLDFCLVKRQKIMKIHIKWLQDGSWGALELRREKRALAFFCFWPPGPQFGPDWGEAWDPKAAPREALGRQKGSQEPFQEVKKRSGEVQNDICMLISSPSSNFHVFLNFRPSKLQRNGWNKYTKNTLKKNQRLWRHHNADMHNPL